MSRKHFVRGYFCAVSVALREHGLTTAVRNMFAQGGDPNDADPQDIELFREHGLMPPESWQPVTGPGQVKMGDKLRFTIGDNKYSETAKLILHPGTDKEEVIYSKRRNFYFIMAMVMSGFSNHKNVEFMSRAPATNGTASQEPKPYDLTDPEQPYLPLSARMAMYRQEDDKDGEAF